MTEKERAFLDEIQVVCDKHNVAMWDDGIDLFFVDTDIAKTNIEIKITEDLLNE